MGIYEITIKVTAKGYKNQILKGISAASTFTKAKEQVIEYLDKNLKHPSDRKSIKVVKHSVLRGDFIINEKVEK